MKKNLILSLLVMTSLMVMILGSVIALEDTEGPTFGDTIIEPTDPKCGDKSITINSDITDESGVAFAELIWKYDGGNENHKAPQFEDGAWITKIYIGDPEDGMEITYRIKATDNLGNIASTAWHTLFTYDCSAPLINVDGAPSGLLVTKTSIPATVTCDDTISGCDEVKYNVDTTEQTSCSTDLSKYTNYVDSVPITERSWVCAYAKDNAGNERFSSPVEFKVFYTIQSAINNADPYDTVNIYNDNYPETLDINKALTLMGESKTGVIVDASSSSDYGIDIGADNVIVEKLTLIGPDNYGFKPSHIDNLTLRDLIVQGSGISEIDLNAVTNSLIENVKADGLGTGGVGIALTQSSNIELKNIETLNNQWGGVGLFDGSVGSTHDITFSGINTFDEANPVYVDAEYDFGVSNIMLPGFTHSVENPTFMARAEDFTFYQQSENNAIALALALVNPEDSYIQTLTIDGSGFIQQENNFVVGEWMSIQAAIDAAQPGAIINVRTGNYDESILINRPLTLIGENGAIISGQTGKNAVSIGVGRVTINGFEITSTSGVFGIAEITSVTGTIITNNTIHGFPALGIALAAGSDGAFITNNELYDVYAGIYLSTGAKDVIINSNNVHNLVSGSGPDQGAALVFEGNNIEVSAMSNTFNNNAFGFYVWNFGSDFTNTIIKNNTFVGNSIGVKNTNAGFINAEDNWWGTTIGSEIDALISGNVDYTPWAYNSNLDTDHIAPTFTINYPDEGSLFASNFNVSITDSDTGGAGLNLVACEYRINGGNWLSRVCGNNLLISVGNEMDCDTEGENVCEVEVKAVDNSGNNVLEERTFSIDWTNAPQILDSGPSGTIWNQGTFVYVKTNKPATCKYDISYKTSYDFMNFTMEITGGINHKQGLSDLLDKQYAYYVLCQDSKGNEMTQTVSILFDVDTRENFVVTIPETKGDYLGIGWNQFFLPSFVLDDTSLGSYEIDEVLASIEGEWDMIYHFDGTDWKITSYVPGREVNDLEIFNGGEFPYFIHMNVTGQRIELI